MKDKKLKKIENSEFKRLVNECAWNIEHIRSSNKKFINIIQNDIEEIEKELEVNSNPLRWSEGFCDTLLNKLSRLKFFMNNVYDVYKDDELHLLGVVSEVSESGRLHEFFGKLNDKVILKNYSPNKPYDTIILVQKDIGVDMEFIKCFNRVHKVEGEVKDKYREILNKLKEREKESENLQTYGV